MNIVEPINQGKIEMSGASDSIQVMGQEESVGKLISEMVSGRIGRISPVLADDSELGFSYPKVEKLLGMNTRDVISLCELLVDENILQRNFHKTIITCPNCGSASLDGKFSCPRCSSANIAMGRLLEHFACGNIAVEDEYKNAGGYICPKCQKKLKFLGTDYRSIGVNYICHVCHEIFTKSVTHWQCLKCACTFKQGEANSKELYSYEKNDSNNLENWLVFEVELKAQFIKRLRNLGYDVQDRGDTKGLSSKSGVPHTLSIVARKDNGFVVYTVGVGVLFSSQLQDVSVDKVFRFDEKAFDLGIRDKIIIALPEISENVRFFAQQQRIRLFGYKELATFLATTGASATPKGKKEPLHFQDRTQFLAYLENLGYRVELGVSIEGKSGAKHAFDIVTYYDDGIVSHTMGICFISQPNPVDCGTVMLFNARAYDAGINDKVLIVSPCLSREADQYARKQNTKVILVENPRQLEL